MTRGTYCFIVIHVGLFKRKESVDCDMNVTFCKVALAKRVANTAVSRIGRNVFDSYASDRHNGDRSLLNGD